MSRGLGPLQRRIREVLYAAENQGLSPRELRRRLGEPDRSNLRRAIRGLLKREVVEVSCSSGERRVELTVFGYIGTSLSLAPPRSPPASASTVLEELQHALREVRVEEAARPRWVSYEHRFVRRRLPGETQRRIIVVLQEYAEPVEEGLPVSVVKAIVGGDRSNTRRAIRSLLLRGLLEELEDGSRVRLWPVAVPVTWPIPREPVDDRHAREVLRAYHELSHARRT